MRQPSPIRSRKKTENAADQLWDLCNEFVELSLYDAPENDLGEFISFCGVLGVGELGSRAEHYSGKALAKLKALSRDKKWRIREAVCMGLQKLLRRYPETTLEAFQNWILGGDPLEMRAVVAAVSDTELLQDQDLADKALRFHKEIIDQIKFFKDRKAKPFRALRKALGYILSILVCALPEAGLSLLDELIVSRDTDLHWIAKSNLKKRRLLRDFPEEAETRLRGL